MIPNLYVALERFHEYEQLAVSASGYAPASIQQSTWPHCGGLLASSGHRHNLTRGRKNAVNVFKRDKLQTSTSRD